MNTMRIMLCVALVGMCASAFGSAIWEYEIQNKSGTDADDLHLVFKHKVENAKNGAFTDPPSGIGSNVIHWPAPGGSGLVPAGYKMWFKTVEPTDGKGGASAGIMPDLSYFTTGGVKIPNSVKWTDCDGNQTWDQDSDTGIWKASVGLHNPSLTNAVYVSNFQVYDYVPMAHFNIDEFNAGFGMLRGDIPPEFWLMPGDAVDFDLGEHFPDSFVTWTCEIAPESDLTSTGRLWVGSALPWPGDSNFDRKVDGADLAIWQVNYDPLGLLGEENSFDMGNWDGDDKIDGADLAIWQQNYEPLGVLGTAGTTAVPEPGTMALLALGGLALLRRRRK